MTFFETVAYAIIFGAIGFFIGFIAVSVPIRRNNRVPRVYQFKKKKEEDMSFFKERIQSPVANGSSVDGAKAVDNFKEQ